MDGESGSCGPHCGTLGYWYLRSCVSEGELLGELAEVGAGSSARVDRRVHRPDSRPGGGDGF